MTAGPGGEPQKESVVVFRWGADGAVHQKGVWGSNKLVDLEAGGATVNTAELPDMVGKDAAMKAFNLTILQTAEFTQAKTI